MAALSEADLVVGKNVEVTTINQGIFRGQVVRFSPEEEEEVILKNVRKISGPSGDADTEDPSLPSKVFFKADQPKMRFLDADWKQGGLHWQRGLPSFPVIQKIIKPAHLNKTRDASDAELVEQVPIVNIPMLMDHEIIDDINGDKFKETIQLLSKKSVLGMAVRGVKLSRFGKLSWIALATEDKAFLFDMKTMGDDAFKGLEELLGDKTRIKAVHHCRFIVDYLYHRHRIQLRKVWDTQVASSVVFQNAHFGDTPKYLEPLNSCLVNHLGMSPDALPVLYKREYTISDDGLTDDDMWEQRPLKTELVQYLVGEVMYLKDLKRILTEKMLDKFLTGVDVFLETVKTAPDHHVEKLLNGFDLMPTEFLWMAEREAERKEEYLRG